MHRISGTQVTLGLPLTASLNRYTPTFHCSPIRNQQQLLPIYRQNRITLTVWHCLQLQGSLQNERIIISLSSTREIICKIDTEVTAE